MVTLRKSKNCNPKKSYPCGHSCQSNSHGGACTLVLAQQLSTYFQVLKTNNAKAKITVAGTEAKELVDEKRAQRDKNFETAKKFSEGESTTKDIWGPELDQPPKAFSKAQMPDKFNKQGHYNVYRNNFLKTPPKKEDGTSAVVLDQKETSIKIDDNDLKSNFPDPKSQERIKRAEEILNRQGQVFSNDGKSNENYTNKRGHQKKLAEEILVLEDKKNPLSILDKPTKEITPEDVAAYHKKVLSFNDFTDEEIAYIYSHVPRAARSKLNSTGVPSQNQGHYGGEKDIIPNKKYEQDDARGMAVLKRYLEQDGKDAYDGMPVHIYDVDYEHIVPGESDPNQAWSGSKYQREGNLVGSDHPDNMVLVRGGINKNRGASNLGDWRKTRVEDEKIRDNESLDEWRERINKSYEEQIAAEAAGESPTSAKIKAGMAKRQNEIFNAPSFEEAKRIATEEAIKEVGAEEAKKRKADIKDYTERFQLEGDISVRPEIQKQYGWNESKVSGTSTKYGLARPNGRGSAGYPGPVVDKMIDLRYTVGPDAARILGQKTVKVHKDYFEDADANEFLRNAQKVMEEFGMEEKEIKKALQTFGDRAATTVKVAAGKKVKDNKISQEVSLKDAKGNERKIQRPDDATLRTNHKERTELQKQHVKDYVNGLVQETMEESNG